MDHRSVSSKLPIDEYTEVVNYCKKKEISPSALIHELLLEEMEPTVPARRAGRNRFDYDKKKDLFTWCIELDSGKKITAAKNLSPELMKNLTTALTSALANRDELLNQSKRGSVAIPKKLIRG